MSFSSAQSLSRVRLFVTPWTTAHQASQSITNSWSLLKLMSIELRQEEKGMREDQMAGWHHPEFREPKSFYKRQ